MVVDLSDPVSFGWVDIQHLLYQVLEVFTDKIRENIIPRKYLFVELCGIVVLKGQIPANHSEQDDPTRPDIHLKAVVLLAADHLRRGVAGRPTGSLQQFPRFVSVAQPEIYNLQGILPIYQ